MAVMTAVMAGVAKAGQAWSVAAVTARETSATLIIMEGWISRKNPS